MLVRAQNGQRIEYTLKNILFCALVIARRPEGEILHFVQDRLRNLASRSLASLGVTKKRSFASLGMTKKRSFASLGMTKKRSFASLGMTKKRSFASLGMTKKRSFASLGMT